MSKTNFSVNKVNDTIVVNKNNNLDIISVLKYNFKKNEITFFSRTIVFPIDVSNISLTIPVSIGSDDFSFNLDNKYDYTYQNIIDLSLNEFSENIKKNRNGERNSIKSILINHLESVFENKSEVDLVLDDPNTLEVALLYL